MTFYCDSVWFDLVSECLPNIRHLRDISHPLDICHLQNILHLPDIHRLSVCLISAITQMSTRYPTSANICNLLVVLCPKIKNSSGGYPPDVQRIFTG